MIKLIPLEKTIRTLIVRFLRLNGVFCWVNRNERSWQRFCQNEGDLPGVSDICGVLKPNGLFFAFEVKRPGRPAPFTDAQKNFRNKVRSSGGIAERVESIEEVAHHLRNYLNRNVIHTP